MKFLEKLENTFSAIAFAEAGEHDTAVKMMGPSPGLKKVRRLFEDYMTAITFAEAGCHDEARLYLNGPLSPVAVGTPGPQVVGIRDFIAVVGLERVNFKYGLAQVA